MHCFRGQAHAEGGSSTPVVAGQLGSPHSGGRRSLRRWRVRRWAAPQAASDGTCWHGYLGVPGPDLVLVHSSSSPVTSSSSLGGMLTQCNAERHLSCFPRPPPLSRPSLHCPGMPPSPRSVVSLDPVVPAAPEGDVCPCCHHSLQKRSRGSGWWWGPAALRPGQEAPSQLRGAAEVPVALTQLTQAPEEERCPEEEVQVEVRSMKGAFSRPGAPRSPGHGGKQGAGVDKGQVWVCLSAGWRCPAGGQGRGQPAGRPARCR